MINRTILTGRLTKDVELRYTSSNLAVCKFTLAVDRTFTSDNGERGCDYIQIVCWRKQAENVSKFCHKGSLVGVDGRIQTGSYDNKDGVRVYTTEVVADSVSFLDSKKDTFNDKDSEDIYNDIKAGEEKKKYERTLDVGEDDLPF